MNQCSECGAPTKINQRFCTECGVKITQSEDLEHVGYCEKCGKSIKENQDVCLHCGERVNPRFTKYNAEKSKLAAGLLGIFVGAFGIHNFYLGYTNKAITQLLLSTVGALVIIGPIIASVWGLVEGILILTGSIDTDAEGEPLGE